MTGGRITNSSTEYHRYYIDTCNTLGIASWPTRFRVRVGKIGLAKHLFIGMITTGFNMDVVLSRPCIYGVFSGPIGGFAPRPEYCVACLRCMNEYYKFVCISPNTDLQKLGDSYFTFKLVDQLTYEAETGMVLAKGAGYRGKFGGEGFDSMWTDVSEIVRPSCDGIRGRELISTSVDIGSKPNFLVFNDGGQPEDGTPITFSLPVPFIFDLLPNTVEAPSTWQILSQTAKSIQTLAIVPFQTLRMRGLAGTYIVPLVNPNEAEALSEIPFTPCLVELDGWDAAAFARIKEILPETQTGLRIPFGADLLYLYRQGVRVFHLTADYHGRSVDGTFILDSIRQTHKTFVDAAVRDEVTIIGSGGLIAAEHLPKAIICGLDLVALDTPIVVALQGMFDGECVDRATSCFVMPKKLSVDWGVQRIKNTCASWRDQLLEVLGSMGIHDVRRLRGEVGRAMFMKEMEAKAFAGMDSYECQE